MSPLRPLRILLVEDNPGDVRLLREALRELGRSDEIEAVPDGVEALARLRRDGAGRPDLILLDLNLPRLDGRETLRALKENQDLRDIPVVVYSSSRSEDDVTTSYALRADGYVTKPPGFDDFARVFQAIDAFWLGVTSLAGPSGPGADRQRGRTP